VGGEGGEEVTRIGNTLAEACDLLEEIQAQWGDDPLWKKWQLSKQIADLRAIQQEECPQ
jgi:hypothetical protein